MSITCIPTRSSRSPPRRIRASSRKEIFGDEIGWLPWRRPGFQLGLDLEAFARANPDAKGVVLESHGLFTWADDAKECYELTLRIINRPSQWFAEKTAGKAAFGGAVTSSLSREERRRIAARLMPEIRGKIGQAERKLGHFDDQAAVLEFVNSANLKPLAPLGTSCPDHFLRTKIRPLVLDFDPKAPDVDAVARRPRCCTRSLPRRLRALLRAAASIRTSPAMRDPNPVIFLIPGVGMLSFARDKATARIASEFYVNAINVMRGASSVSEYQGLPEQEAFDIEYWLLEEAKLQRMPKPKSLAGRVAFVTGGAGGIGRATAERLVGEGACVVLADIDQESLDRRSTISPSVSARMRCAASSSNVTSEAAVLSSFVEASVEFGGIDILVSNAGIASSAPVEDTELAMWNRNIDILATGYFLVSREAFRLFRRQKLGGNMVFVAVEERARRLSQRLRLLHRQGSRDPSRPLPGARRRGGRHPRATWSIPMRCCAAPRSGPANGASSAPPSSKLAVDELEEHYRKRSLLKLNVLSGGHRRGDLFPCVRPLGQVDRQHHQCRCRQRDSALRAKLCPGRTP